VRIQPREQTLDVWESVAKYSLRDGQWNWGGRDGRNSICDAEQLLCLLYPATEVADFRLNSPDHTEDDVLQALRPLGDRIDIPKKLLDVIGDYMSTYTADDGTPIFSGGSYFSAMDPEATLTEEQRRLAVVDSYATSLSLTLATLSFLKVFARDVHRPALKEKIAHLETVTSTRLSAAMVGLLRSFSVAVFDPDSLEGTSLCDMLNQEGKPNKVVLANLHRELTSLRANLRDATLGLGEIEALDNENMLFECGWSWGVVRGAPVIDTAEPVGPQSNGVALSAPYLYFTVVALDAIADLKDDRVLVENLLNPEQRRLAVELNLRWTVTLTYWSTLARFGEGKWPLEAIPWRAIDGIESEYFSLLVTAVVLQDLLNRRATDDDLTRTVAVLEKLVTLGRIDVTKHIRDTFAISLHTPGVPLELHGSTDLGPLMQWSVADFAVVLLKRSLRGAGLSRNSGARDRLLGVAEHALGHMWLRRLRGGPGAGLWDDPSELLANADQDQVAPSWYMTKRVIECLAGAATTISAPPIRSARLNDVATDLFGEADHLFSQDKLASSAERGSVMHKGLARIENRLERARKLLRDQPGTACALVIDVLQELDELAVARQDALGTS
jgi:hypothetical protein